MIDLEKLRKLSVLYEVDNQPMKIDVDLFRELLDHIAQLEKDAARWNAATRNMELNDICVVVYDNFGDGRAVTGEEADQAIDTAMESNHG